MDSNSNDFFNLYADLPSQSGGVELKKRGDLKLIYFQFLHDFREHVIDYVRESNQELAIVEMLINTNPIPLFGKDVIVGRYITFKNQGEKACYLSTTGKGGFRLDPREKERFWVNKPVYGTTLEEMTVLGIIMA